MLIRALEPVAGIDAMRARRGVSAAGAALLRAGQAHPGARDRARVERHAISCGGPLRIGPRPAGWEDVDARGRRADRHHQGGRAALALLRARVAERLPAVAGRACGRGGLRRAPPRRRLRRRASAARRRRVGGRRRLDRRGRRRGLLRGRRRLGRRGLLRARRAARAPRLPAVRRRLGCRRDGGGRRRRGRRLGRHGGHRRDRSSSSSRLDVAEVDAPARRSP